MYVTLNETFNFAEIHDGNTYFNKQSSSLVKLNIDELLKDPWLHPVWVSWWSVCAASFVHRWNAGRALIGTYGARYVPEGSFPALLEQRQPPVETKTWNVETRLFLVIDWSQDCRNRSLIWRGCAAGAWPVALVADSAVSLLVIAFQIWLLLKEIHSAMFLSDSGQMIK